MAAELWEFRSCRAKMAWQGFYGLSGIGGLNWGVSGGKGYLRLQRLI